MNIIFRTVVSILLISSLLASCTKVWHDPNTSVPSKKVDITSILVTPTIYDGAGVEIEGKVWDLLMEHSQNGKDKDTYSMFKLADEEGNYLNVKSKSTLPLVTEGELVKVIGVYRLTHDPETNKIQNVVEAYSIEK